jgi:hypothetical protein
MNNYLEYAAVAVMVLRYVAAVIGAAIVAATGAI